MDTDFMDRTVLKHITDYGYEPLLRDDKASALLDELWVGKDTYQCDGRNTDYSKIFFLVNASLKPLPKKKLEINAILCSSFKRSIENEQFEV
jgi:hypothetical protein